MKINFLLLLGLFILLLLGLNIFSRIENFDITNGCGAIREKNGGVIVYGGSDNKNNYLEDREINMNIRNCGNIPPLKINKQKLKRKINKRLKDAYMEGYNYGKYCKGCGNDMTSKELLSYDPMTPAIISNKEEFINFRGEPVFKLEKDGIQDNYSSYMPDYDEWYPAK